MQSNESRTSAISAGERDLQSCVRRVSFKFLQHVMQGEAPGNIVVSPLSVIMALQVIVESANDRWKGIFLERLGLTVENETERRQAALNLKRDIERLSEGATVLLANSIWVAPDVQVHPVYRQVSEQFYEADVLPLTSQSAINAWCSKRTRGLIQSIPPFGGAAVVILNATYVKGKWDSPFRPADTQEADFASDRGKRTKCQMMMQTHSFGYYQDPKLQAISLPYGNDSLALYAIKPAAGIAAILPELTDDRFYSISRVLNKSRELVSLRMPRFEFTTDCDLAGVLSSLGFGELLSRDCSPISAMRKDDLPLYVEKAVQLAKIVVNEEGAEAAAVSAIFAHLGCARPVKQPKPIEMNLDRPFIYAIVDTKQHVPIFLGVVAEPG